jgi:hypothetical protein
MADATMRNALADLVATGYTNRHGPLSLPNADYLADLPAEEWTEADMQSVYDVLGMSTLIGETLDEVEAYIGRNPMILELSPSNVEAAFSQAAEQAYEQVHGRVAAPGSKASSSFPMPSSTRHRLGIADGTGFPFDASNSFDGGCYFDCLEDCRSEADFFHAQCLDQARFAHDTAIGSLGIDAGTDLTACGAVAVAGTLASGGNPAGGGLIFSVCGAAVMGGTIVSAIYQLSRFNQANAVCWSDRHDDLRRCSSRCSRQCQQQNR